MSNPTRPTAFITPGLFASTLLLCALGLPARAANFTVNTTADENDSPSGANVSLREAMRDAAASGGADDIDFAAALSGTTITLTQGKILNLDAGGITVDAIALAGGLTIKGIGTQTLFQNHGVLTLRGLALTGGYQAPPAFPNGGGALYNANTGTLVVERCEIFGNSGGSGGGVFNDGILTMNRCSIARNSVTGGGGALYNTGTATLTQCTLSENSSGGGGAINIYQGSVTLDHCTVSGNSATYWGGISAPLGQPQALSIRNSIVAGNSGAEGADIDCDASCTFTKLGANIVQTVWSDTPIVGSGTLIYAAPRLAPLSNYGGTMRTMAPGPSSPAIDARAGSTEAIDQRGFPRPVDGNGDLSAVADIGAVELDAALFDLSQLVVTNTADSGSGSLRHAIATASVYAGANTITFAAALSGQTIPSNGGFGLSDADGVTIDASALPAGLKLDGGNASRVIINGGKLTLRALTLTGGATAASGGGGAILNQGGGILTVERCTVSGNAAGYGAGLFNTATATLTQSTLAGNTASTLAGAVYNAGTLTLTHATVSANVSSSEVGGIYNGGGGQMTLANSAVGVNTGTNGADIHNAATIIAVGYNMVPTMVNAGSVFGSGTIFAANPNLSALADNGGPTRTVMPISPGNSVNLSSGSTITTDQRGYAVSGVPDIGACEFNGYVPGPYIVTTLADSGAGSLRQMIGFANGAPGADVITFAPALSGQTIALTGGPLLPADSSGMTIDASALPAGITIRGNGADRTFVGSGNLTLRALTISGGFLPPCCGGAGIYQSAGALTAERCTITGNSAGYGAAVFVEVGAAATLTQCTIAGNSVSAQAGGIYNRGTTTLNHTTVSDNSAAVEQGGIYNHTGHTLTLSDSIVGGNTGPNGADLYNAGTLTRLGTSIVPNLIQNGTLAGGGTMLTATPLLAPLGDYGGPTQTMALMPGSPAREGATGATFPADQRGFAIFGAPDIGAYESGYQGNYNAWIWERLPVGATVPQHAGAYDYDGDSATNQQEWLAGTDPASSSAVFTLRAARVTSTLWIDLLQMQPGRLYTLQESDSQTPAAWINTPGVSPLDGDLSGTAFSFPTPAAALRFYRVTTTIE